MAVAEAPHGQVADQRGGERRHERVVANPPYRLHLERENGTRERNAEDRTEPGRDRSDQHGAAIPGSKAEQPRGEVGQAARHLDGGALAADRGPEQVTRERAHQHEGGEAPRQPRRRLVDLVDDHRVAAGRATAQVVVHRANRQARRRQQVQQPGPIDPSTGHPLEGFEEDVRGRPGEHPRHRAQHDPAAQVHDQAALLAQPAERWRIGRGPGGRGPGGCGPGGFSRHGGGLGPVGAHRFPQRSRARTERIDALAARSHSTWSGRITLVGAISPCGRFTASPIAAVEVTASRPAISDRGPRSGSRGPARCGSSAASTARVPASPAPAP